MKGLNRIAERGVIVLKRAWRRGGVGEASRRGLSALLALLMCPLGLPTRAAQAADTPETCGYGVSELGVVPEDGGALYYRFSEVPGNVEGVRELSPKLQEELAGLGLTPREGETYLAVSRCGDVFAGYVLDKERGTSQAALFYATGVYPVGISARVSAAYATSRDGVTVGGYETESGVFHAFMVRVDGRIVDMTESLAGSGCALMTLTDVNAAGEMVGHGYNAKREAVVVAVQPTSMTTVYTLSNNQANLESAPAEGEAGLPALSGVVPALPVINGENGAGAAGVGDRSMPGGLTAAQLNPSPDESGYAEVVGSVSGGWSGGAYSIPIRVMPSFPGVTPSFAVSISGSGRSGSFGIGGDLDGLSSITLVEPTVSTAGRCGSAFSGDAQLALDGKSLVRLSNNGPNGVGIPYSWNSVMDDLGNNVEVWFTTEIESNIRITCQRKEYNIDGKPCWAISQFTVYLGDGSKWIYGNLDAADSDGDFTGESGSLWPKPFMWSIVKKEDVYGHGVRYSYYKNAALNGNQLQGDYRLKSAKYNTGRAGEFCRVDFSYVEKAESARPPHYIGGSRIMACFNIGEIKVYDQLDAMVWRYQFGYDQDPRTGSSRLKTVTYYDEKRFEKLKPLTIGWSEDSAGTWLEHMGVTTLGAFGSRWMPININNDGRGDFVEVVPGGPYSGFGLACIKTSTGDTNNPLPGINVFPANPPKYFSQESLSFLGLFTENLFRKSDCPGETLFGMGGYKISASSANGVGYQRWTGGGWSMLRDYFSVTNDILLPAESYIPGDFNGDNRSDVLVIRGIRDQGVNVPELYTVNGNTFVNQPIYPAGTTFGVYNSIHCGKCVEDLWIPLNLDGKGGTDLAKIYSDADGNAHLALFYSQPGNAANTFYAPTIEDNIIGKYDLANVANVADMNGDGVDEIVFREKSFGRICTNSLNSAVILTSKVSVIKFNPVRQASVKATVTMSSPVYIVGASVPCSGLRKSEYHEILIADINGDGLHDRLVIRIDRRREPGYGDPDKYTIEGYLSRGDGEVPSIYAGTWEYLCPLSENYSYSFSTDDFNRDGVVDLAIRMNAFNPGIPDTPIQFMAIVPLALPGYPSGTVWGNTLETLPCLGDMYGAPYPANDARYAPQILVTDQDGDGQLDYLKRMYSSAGGGVVQYDLFKARTIGAPHLPTVFDDGYSQVKVTYGMMSDTNVYTPYSNGQYPLVDATVAAAPLVACVERMTGTGKFVKEKFKYEGQKVDQNGRGSQGYKRVRTEVEGPGYTNITVVENRQDFPYSGLVDRSMEYLRVGNHPDYLISSNQHWYESTALGTRYKVREESSVSTRYDYPTGTAISREWEKTYSWDEYGNPTEIVTEIKKPTGSGWDGEVQHVERCLVDYLNGPMSGGVFGLPTNIVVSVSKDGVIWDAPREIQLTYSSQGDLLVSTAYPDDAEIKLTKVTDYTAAGMVKSISLNGSGQNIAISSLLYPEDSLYPNYEFNSLGGVTEISWDKTYGTPFRVKDSKGFITVATFGIGGRDMSSIVYSPDNSTALGSRYIHYLDPTDIYPHTAPAHTTMVTLHNNGPDLPRSFRMYDRNGNLLRTMTESFNYEWLIVDQVFDDYNRLLATSVPYIEGDSIPGWTSYEYDEVGRLKKKTSPDGAVSMVSYSILSKSIKYPNGSTVSKTNNVLGQLVSTTDADGKITYINYNAVGLVETVNGPAGVIASNTYNAAGKLIAQYDPDQGITSNRYDAFGRMIKITDSMGQQVAMEYDGAGRLIRRTDAQSKSEWTFGAPNAPEDLWKVATYKLSGAAPIDGSPITQSPRETLLNSKEIHYDSCGRVDRVTTRVGGENFTIGTQYDPFHNRVAKTIYPTGFAVGYDYTDIGYLKAVSNAPGYYGDPWFKNNPNTQNVVYIYIDASLAAVGNELITHTILGNGLRHDMRIDPLNNRLKSDWIYNYAGGPQNFMRKDSYGYDDMGNLSTNSYLLNVPAQYNGQTVVEKYRYDAQNRLSYVNDSAAGAGTSFGTYEYDPNTGNMRKKGYNLELLYENQTQRYAATKVKQNGVLSWTGVYDSRGRMTSSWRSKNGGLTTEISYTPLDQVQKMTLKDSGGNITQQVDYQYDEDGAKIVRSEGSKQTVSIAGGLFERETLSGGIVKEKHAIPGGVALYIKQAGTSDKTVYLHKDRRGSVELVTSATGALLERYSYDAWGARRTLVGATPPGSLQNGQFTERGYSGARQLDQLDLIDLNARMYNPYIGRFISQDPLGDNYTYCYNNPVNFVDPSGLRAVHPDTYEGDHQPEEDEELPDVPGHWIEGIEVVASRVKKNERRPKWFDEYSPPELDPALFENLEFIRKFTDDDFENPEYFLGKESPLTRDEQKRYFQESITGYAAQQFWDYPITKYTVNAVGFIATGGIEGAIGLYSASRGIWQIIRSPNAGKEIVAAAEGTWLALKQSLHDYVNASVVTDTRIASDVAAQSAELGSKLEYVLGRAAGREHNIERSKAMLNQLESIGLWDTPATRQLLTENLQQVLQQAGVPRAKGRILRESLLMGPQGGVKVQSVWEGNKLITVILLGGGG